MDDPAEDTPPRRILVVDDDAFLRRLVTALLVRGGFVVVEAGSAEEGLAHLATDQPDLLLLDVELPEMSGLDLLRRLTTPLTCPVVLMSGNDTDADRDAAFAAGAVDYIVKPFAPSELAARVQAALPATR